MLAEANYPKRVKLNILLFPDVSHLRQTLLSITEIHGVDAEIHRGFIISHHQVHKPCLPSTLGHCDSC